MLLMQFMGNVGLENRDDHRGPCKAIFLGIHSLSTPNPKFPTSTRTGWAKASSRGEFGCQNRITSLLPTPDSVNQLHPEP